MQKLVLIDGNAILHRAFHALPPLTSKNGEVVNAVYGFFSMFLKVLGNLKPDYIVVCFDRKAPTFRKQMYVGYQAKRPKMSDDLVPQIEIVHNILNKAKVTIFEVDGYEADDLIGTVSRQAVEGKLDGGLDVVIVSGDRDMLQLINSHVEVLAPIVGITKMILFDSAKVEEKYGLKPSQFIDYKAFVGDSSDNYPGVAGIGPKTAMTLLKKYDNFENLYKHLSELPEKTAVKLSTDAEQAALAKKLATIVTNAPIALKLDSCKYGGLDINALRDEFEKLGFKSLLKKINSEEKLQQEQVKEKSKQMELL